MTEYYRCALQTISGISIHRNTYVVVLLCIALVSGCEEDPNPFIGRDEPFTIFGFLNPKAERQVIRVIPLAASIDQIGVGADQATVRTTHIETGEQRVWKDSLVTFSDGSEAIVFFSDFTPLFEQNYRMEVIRKDGATSRVEVEIPKDITIRRLPDSNPLSPQFLLEGELPNMVQVAVKYGTFALQPQLPIVLDPISFPIALSYRGEEVSASEGWEYRISYNQDFIAIRKAFEDNCLTKEFIAVLSARLDFFVGNDEWVPPGGEFDPELLVSPNLFSNVENGFGYFGAGYPVSFDVMPSTPVLEASGFDFIPPCRGIDMLPPDHPNCEVLPGCMGE